MVSLSVWAERHALLELKLKLLLVLLMLLLLLRHHCSIHGSQVGVYLLILHLLLVLLLLLLQVWRDGPTASRRSPSSSPSSSKVTEVKGGPSNARSIGKEASSSSSCCGGRRWQQPLRLRWYPPIFPARGKCTHLAAVANTAAATAVIATTSVAACGAACGAACSGVACSGGGGGGGVVSRWALSLDNRWSLASYCCGGSLKSRAATITCYHCRSCRSCWWCWRYLTNSSRRRRHVQLHLCLHLHGEVRGWVESHR